MVHSAVRASDGGQKGVCSLAAGRDPTWPVASSSQPAGRKEPGTAGGTRKFAGRPEVKEPP